MRNHRLGLLTVMALTPALLAAEVATAPDAAEPGSIEEIARATTETRFLSPWVATCPLRPAWFRRALSCTASREHRASSSTPAAAYGYCRALAGSSPRVRLFSIGRSEEGRDIVLLAIADEQGIRDLERLKAATAALADPRRTDPAAAEQLIASARPIYYINAGAALRRDRLDRVGARARLSPRGLGAAHDPPHPREARGAHQPDRQSRRPRQAGRMVLPLSQGQDRPGTLPRQAPPYWSKYAYVDINRDAHQQVHATTKAVFRMMFGLASAGDPRSARERGAARDLERHRADQRARRPAHLRRAARAELPRGADAHRHSACRACGPGTSATTSLICISMPSRPITTPMAAATRLSATAPPRR